MNYCSHMVNKHRLLGFKKCNQPAPLHFRDIDGHVWPLCARHGKAARYRFAGVKPINETV